MDYDWSYYAEQDIIKLANNTFKELLLDGVINLETANKNFSEWAYKSFSKRLNKKIEWEMGELDRLLEELERING